jgi:threonine/homoserine efflux transporter RhtA
VTRIVSIWALFAVVLAACWFLGRRRGVDAGRLISAWALSSVLLWVCAGLLGYAGARATAASDPRRGIGVGIGLGALVGAPLGIALSERIFRRPWPRLPALALAAVGLLLAVGAFLFLLTQLRGPEQHAGRSVYVAFPLLGAAAVLGWLTAERR